MSHELLATLWYLVVGFSIIAYTILDGFDLGVGILHLFARGDQNRRIFLNAIGPVWDGNEVWLVIVGGALFAGFPEAYATLFSGFYNLCMILLAALIFRACAIEFRSKGSSTQWRNFWDVIFFLGSLLIAFGVGLALGSLVEGIPLDANHDFVKAEFNLWRPYPILLGWTSVALVTMHGAIYLTMKTEGGLQRDLQRWCKRAIALFIFFYVVTTCATLLYMPHMLDRMRELPFLFGVSLFALLAILNVPREMKRRKFFRAFLSSSGGIALLILLFGIGMFPDLIHSTIDPKNNSLTLMNAASSSLTLRVLLIIVAIGIPLVLMYMSYIYRTFRGKVRLTSSSY
jgi:cytochrome d ubiquinol oxidase subunit II